MVEIHLLSCDVNYFFMIKNLLVSHCRIYYKCTILEKKFENSIYADYAII